MFSQTSVILFSQGGTDTPQADTPPAEIPLLADTPGQIPPGQPPLGQTPPTGRRLLLRTVRTLLECILVDH